MIRHTLVTIITIILLGCKNETPKIVNISNLEFPDGFVDVPLSIIDTKEFDDYYEYDTSATLREKRVGLIIRLKKDIPAGFVNGKPKNMFVEDGIEFISKGEESDGLLAFLSDSYKLQNKRYGLQRNEQAIFKTSQVFTCANLNQKQPNYKTGENRFKIFLEGEDEYAELFVNFNFTKSIISLNEKDEGYRAPLIKLLQKSND